MMVGKAVAQVVAKLSKMLLHFPPSIMFMLHTYRSHEYTHTHTNTHTHTQSLTCTHSCCIFYRQFIEGERERERGGERGLEIRLG